MTLTEAIDRSEFTIAAMMKDEAADAENCYTVESINALRVVLDAAKTRQRQTEEALKLLRELDGELN